MKKPSITTDRFWSIRSIRQACIENELYTCGDNEEYDKMLTLADSLYPSIENLYTIAKDIMEHSEDQTITNIMYILENEAITTTFIINGQEDI